MDIDDIILIILFRINKIRNEIRKQMELCKEPYDEHYWNGKFLKPRLEELKDLLSEINTN